MKGGRLDQVIEGFTDELRKLAAMKVRSGRRPIRAQRLAEAGSVSKVGQAPAELAGGLGRALVRNWPTLALVGGGGAAALSGRQAVEDLKRGRQMRRAYEQQTSGG